jgi:hypothetical protein
LGRREEVRAGAVLLAAEAEIRRRLAAGYQLRDDGFLGSGRDRSAADEIAEAAVLAAQRDAQEAKAPLMGKLLGGLQFELRVPVAYAHLLIREAEALTYRQLCCLALFNLNLRYTFGLPNGPPLAGTIDPLDPRIGLLQEMLDLIRRTMLQQRASDHPGTDLVSYVPALNPARLEVTGMGGWLSELMDLPHSIPEPELVAIAAILGRRPQS